MSDEKNHTVSEMAASIKAEHAKSVDGDEADDKHAKPGQGTPGLLDRRRLSHL